MRPRLGRPLGLSPRPNCVPLSLSRLFFGPQLLFLASALSSFWVLLLALPSSAKGVPSAGAGGALAGKADKEGYLEGSGGAAAVTVSVKLLRLLIGHVQIVIIGVGAAAALAAGGTVAVPEVDAVGAVERVVAG